MTVCRECGFENCACPTPTNYTPAEPAPTSTDDLYIKIMTALDAADKQFAALSNIAARGWEAIDNARIAIEEIQAREPHHATL